MAMTSPGGEAYDYTAVGHVTIDVLPDGSRRPGGSAFYAALQAARLGARALIVTQGVPAEIEALIEPFEGEVELEIHRAPQTTTLQTTGWGGERRQRMLAWAGPMKQPVGVKSSILHLAPIARETPASVGGAVEFIGLTPQGLVREWSTGGEISLIAPSPSPPALTPRCCDALVLSDRERPACDSLIVQALERGAIAAVTAQEEPTRILGAGEEERELEVPMIDHPRDDLGAGDVFAAAFFLALHEGRPPLEAADFAHAAAAVRVSGEGASGIGSLAEVEARQRAVA
jgi:sugar/nucleoside kinase (ribokinase family)